MYNRSHRQELVKMRKERNMNKLLNIFSTISASTEPSEKDANTFWNVKDAWVKTYKQNQTGDIF